MPRCASASSTAALPLGVWSYVVGTADGSLIHLYLNGKQQSQSSAGPINYGGSPNFDAMVTRYTYSGDLADLAIYPTALSPNQVANHYSVTGYTPGPVSNLVAKASTNSASLTWTPPAYAGTSPVSSYTITPVVDGWGWAAQGLPERMVGWLRRHLGSERSVLP